MELALIKALHIVGFATCILASFLKNMTLSTRTVEGAALGRLILLDRISGLSAVILLTTGIAMAGWLAKPFELYRASPWFWLKVGLFVAASVAVVRTKPVLRQASPNGSLAVKPWLRAFLAFDFIAVSTVALIGLWIANTLA